MDKYTLKKEDSLLLLIDIQERLIKAMAHGDRVVKNTNILLETSKIMDMPILITEQYPRGLGHTVEEISNLHKEVEVFDKSTFTACIDGVNTRLKELGRQKIIIVGMETHVCVLQTCRDLLMEGYDVHIARDAVTSRSQENYENALEMMREMGAVITNTETIVFDLLKKAGTEEFKQVSKLIK